MPMAHDLLLLLLDDETGKTVSWLSQPDKRAGDAPEEPVLRRGLDLVRDKEGKKPDAVLGPLAKDLRDELADDLVSAGILRREERKMLGLFRTERLPTTRTRPRCGSSWARC